MFTQTYIVHTYREELGEDENVGSRSHILSIAWASEEAAECAQMDGFDCVMDKICVWLASHAPGERITTAGIDYDVEVSGCDVDKAEGHLDATEYQAL